VGRRDASKVGRPAWQLMAAVGFASNDGVESEPPGTARHTKSLTLVGCTTMWLNPRSIDQT
jgi:hypothetical protein